MIFAQFPIILYTYILNIWNFKETSTSTLSLMPISLVVSLHQLIKMIDAQRTKPPEDNFIDKTFKSRFTQTFAQIPEAKLLRASISNMKLQILEKLSENTRFLDLRLNFGFNYDQQFYNFFCSNHRALRSFDQRLPST